MKPKQMLLTAVIITGLVLSQTAFAQHTEQSATPVAAASDPYADFQDQLSKAETAAAANDLKIMHKYSEAMAADLKALQNTEMAKDKLIANTLTQAIPVAKSLDTTGDSGDMPGTLAVLKKLQSVNALIKSRLPDSSSENKNDQPMKAQGESMQRGEGTK